MICKNAILKIELPLFRFHKRFQIKMTEREWKKKSESEK